VLFVILSFLTLRGSRSGSLHDSGQFDIRLYQSYGFCKSLQLRTEHLLSMRRRRRSGRHDFGELWKKCVVLFAKEGVKKTKKRRVVCGSEVVVWSSSSSIIIIIIESPVSLCSLSILLRPESSSSSSFY
jgi:hypothetical protein